MKKKRTQEQRKVSLHSAVIFVITALIIQYLLLEGSVMASTQRYLSSHTSAAIDYKALRYLIYDYSLKIELPDDTEVQVSPDKGEEMQFSVYFTNSDLAFRGYIQLWKIKDLESFLNNSKTLSPFDFISYNMSTLQQNLHEGFKTEWSADFGENFISGKEYWWTIKNNEEVVRVSFFTDTAEFPKGLDQVTQHILNSIQVD